MSIELHGSSSSYRAAISLFLGFICASVLGAADYEQRQGSALLRIRGDQKNDQKIEIRLSSTVALTVQIEGQQPLQILPDEQQAVQAQIQALQAGGIWRCSAQGHGKRIPLSDGRERWEQEFQLEPLKVQKGELKLASFEYREGNEGKAHHIHWQPVSFQITTEVASTDVSKELRDITPPEEILEPIPVFQLLSWIGLTIALLGLLVGVWEWWRRRTVTPPTIPAHQWAIGEIQKIDSLNLPEMGEVERYHTLISDIIRGYLEQQFKLQAPRQTTVEFLESMRTAPQLTADQQKLLREFLERCDLAKFAQMRSSPDECRAVAVMARVFVEQTTLNGKPH